MTEGGGNLLSFAPELLATEADTAAAAQRIASLLRPGDCLTLQGEVGAGKTTFMRHLIAALTTPGAADMAVISPSFLLLQDYPITLVDGTQTTLWHLDAYRLSRPDEAEELGLEEILSRGALLCVEWPQKLAGRLPENALGIILEFAEGGARRIIFEAPQRWRNRAGGRAETHESVRNGGSS